MDSADLLSVTDLQKVYGTSGGGEPIRAVDGVDLSLSRGEVVGIVGESGSGKSTLGRCAIGLEPSAKGEVFLRGSSVSTLRGSRLREARKAFQIVFQTPSTSLNPRMTVEQTVDEPLRLWSKASAGERRHRVSEILDDVELAPDVAYRKPGQLSGGQQQRVALARALACAPELILLDEPTSALDIATEVAIFELLTRLRGEHSLAYILISHDIIRVARFADRILIMYAGQVVEEGEAREVMERPSHPYTRGLLSASELLVTDEARLELLDTQEPVPDSGCRLRPRCPCATAGCTAEQELAPAANSALVRCHVVTGSAEADP